MSDLDDRWRAPLRRGFSYFIEITQTGQAIRRARKARLRGPTAHQDGLEAAN